MIIVTGASGDIGKYVFNFFQEKGEEVCGTYNSNGTGDADGMYKVDITSFESVQNFIHQIGSKAKDLILINSAGIPFATMTHKSKPQEWKRVIDVNLTGTYNVIRALLPIMREQDFGRIICFSSVVAVTPTSGVSAYAASKAGLIGLVKSVAIENSKFNITANTINLGYSSIGMGVKDVPKPFQEKMLEKIPKHRFCEPEEIVKTIEYLMETEYITGTSININGGLY